MNIATRSFIHAMISTARIRGCSANEIMTRAQAAGIEANIMRALQEGWLNHEDLGESETATSERLAEFKLKQTARLMLWMQTISTVLPHLSMRYLVLKGAPLGIRLADDAIWRNTSDLDIWIPKLSVETAIAALKALGYEQKEEAHEWATNQIMLEHPMLVPVELHWQMAPPPYSSPSFEEVYARRQTIEYRGIRVDVLSDEDTWIHLLLHAHQHYFAPKTMLDLAMASDRLVVDYELQSKYRLNRMDKLMRSIIQSFTMPPNIERTIARQWYRGMLTTDNRGHLVFGLDSKLEAGAGVIIRAISMSLFEGCIPSIQACMRVVFLGPHRIGAFFHKFLYQFGIK